MANLLMWYRAMEAAEELEKEGISCEIIDPRSLVPFDYDTVLASLEKTGKLMIVHEDHYNCGWGAQLGSYVAENAITLLGCAYCPPGRHRYAYPLLSAAGAVCDPLYPAHH